jgi:penicillin-binding protein 1A
MTDDERTGYSSTATTDRVASVLSPVQPRERRRRGLFRRGKRDRRIRWLRLLAIVVPLSFLAVISMVFGMVLAFAPQLGPLTDKLQSQFENGANSIVYASDGKTELATLTAKNDFFLAPNDIPPIMAHAIVAIEDKRFYTEPGIDYRGIVRAFVADVFHTGGGIQGASTITEQFVKNALNDQKNRTIFNKLREAALAFQLSHLWSKSKILAEYLNTAYFGSGAYGVEAAARAYFGNDPSSNLYHCGIAPTTNDLASLCVTNLTADEAALLAAAVDAPSNFNDLQDAGAATDRRNLVLREMALQGYLTADQATQAEGVSLPPPEDVASPSEEATDPSAGYFTSWVADQLVNHLGYGPKGKSVYTGGYHIITTLDAGLQARAQATVNHVLPPDTGGPAAALVAIDNATGEVKAMVGGYNYDTNPFNLATTAERQPGSAWKVFDLAAALESGYKYNSGILSEGPWVYPQQPGAPNYGPFVVRNDEGGYYNAKIPLWEALAVSDNSAFARLGLEGHIGGTQRIAEVAHQFGISTTISLNPSMVIGGLNVGVTPLDMAHAYETIANGGRLTTGTLTSYTCVGGGAGYALPELQPVGKTCPGPVGIKKILQPGPHNTLTASDTNTTIKTPVADYSYVDDQTEISMMRNVLGPIGTAASAAIPGVPAWGKTGTTSNYADAWFIGSIGGAHGMTVAVWVGYPNSSRSMAKGYGGKPVYGGTYPAQIWRNYVEAALNYYAHPGAAAPRQTTVTSTGATGASSASGSTGASASTSTGAGGATPASQTGTATSPGGATTPSTGATNSPQSTVTSGGGSTIPTTASPPATTTPSISSGGGVTAPTGGAAAPSG